MATAATSSPMSKSRYRRIISLFDRYDAKRESIGGLAGDGQFSALPRDRPRTARTAQSTQNPGSFAGCARTRVPRGPTILHTSEAAREPERALEAGLERA